MRGIRSILFLFFCLTLSRVASAQATAETAEAKDSFAASAQVLADCPRCREAFFKIQRLPLEHRQDFVADPSAFQQAHPEILGLPLTAAPNQGTLLQGPTAGRAVTVGERGPELSGGAETAPGLTGAQMLALRQLTLEGLESSEGAPTGTSASSRTGGIGSRTVRSEEADGGVPTSQDPQYFPPGSDNNGGGNGSGEATPPTREVEAPPELQPTFGKGVQEVFRNAPSYGPVGLIVGAIITIFRDEDPNALPRRAPTPEMQAALPSLLGKGTVNPGNSDPAEQGGLRSMEDPNQAVRVAPAAVANFRPTVGQVVDPNVVDPNPEGGQLEMNGLDGSDPQLDCGGRGDFVRPGSPGNC